MNALSESLLRALNSLAAELERELSADPGSERSHQLHKHMIKLIELMNDLNNGGELGKSV